MKNPFRRLIYKRYGSIKGFMLAETVIAAAILATMVGAYMTFYASVKRNFVETEYDYVALNLCRNILEWGASADMVHGINQKYYYAPATSRTVPDVMYPPYGSCCAGWPNHCGYFPYTGYGLKETACATADYGPFGSLGDIKAKGLVPKGAPNSVVISILAMPDQNYYNAVNVVSSVQWQDTTDGPVKTFLMSTIPLSQHNDQLHLQISAFSWE